MSEYIISDEQIMSERRQAYEAGSRNRMVWTARAFHSEEIVRCRDCIRYSLDDYGNTWCAYVASAVQPDDFCSWGERREDG